MTHKFDAELQEIKDELGRIKRLAGQSDIESSMLLIHRIITAAHKAGQELMREKCAELSANNTPSNEATNVLRCNPKDAKIPYIDSSTMNGYDWVCDDVAGAIRAIPPEG